MKKIRNFIYNNSDILVTLLILVSVVFVISWRVDKIMHYGNSLSSGQEERPPIDIDFSGIDLAPEPDPYLPLPQEGGAENPSGPLIFDENFRSPYAVAVTTAVNDSFETVVRRTASAYDFSEEDYLRFYQLLWTKGTELQADGAKMKAGEYLIPAGSTAEEIIRIVTDTQYE